MPIAAPRRATRRRPPRPKRPPSPSPPGWTPQPAHIQHVWASAKLERGRQLLLLCGPRRRRRQPPRPKRPSQSPPAMARMAAPPAGAPKMSAISRVLRAGHRCLRYVYNQAGLHKKRCGEHVGGCSHAACRMGAAKVYCSVSCCADSQWNRCIPAARRPRWRTHVLPAGGFLQGRVLGKSVE